jgi:tRNA dimethylallyltransferase
MSPESPDAPPVVVVTGPTATGKTPLAIEIALRFGGEIVNADSLQVFRYLDIGTAKATPEQRARVPHHMLDVVTPDIPYSAGLYAEAARGAAARIHTRGAIPVLTGGTGLYIRAFLEGLIGSGAADPRLRAEIEEAHQRAVAEGDPERLHRELAALDPAAAERVHPHDARRVTRALEIARQLGTPSSQVRAAHAFTDRPYRSLHLALGLDRATLAERIDARCEAMIRGGLLQEVRELLDRGYGPELRPMQAIGYRHVIPVARGEDTLDTALAAMRVDTRRFARRQRTWLRSVPERISVDPREPDAIFARVEAFLSEKPDQNGTVV